MADALLTASFANNLIATTQYLDKNGYFRSKLYVSTPTSNQLVAADNQILSLLDRLNISHNLPSIHEIREKIEHELSAFYCRIHNENCTNEFINIAAYLLSATIDELVGKNYLRLYGKVEEFNAFTPSSHAEPQTHFFTIVQRLQEQPNHYLDLLE